MVFIIFNIIVSALTTLAVLWLWERSHPTPEIAQPSAAFTQTLSTEIPSLNSPSENDSLVFTEDIQMNIRTVVGAGNLDAEYVEIVNQSDGAVDLSGWQLMDEEGQTFIFPSLLLYQGGAVEIHSKAGQDTVIELYWQAENPIWESGEIVKLLNPQGELMATYSIP